MLVCPLQGPEGVRGKECFLRVTSTHLFEVELQAARTLERLELQSLAVAELEPETGTQRELVPEVSGGVGVGSWKRCWAFSGVSWQHDSVMCQHQTGCFPPSLMGIWSLGEVLQGGGAQWQTMEEAGLRRGSLLRLSCQLQHLNGVCSYCFPPYSV